VISYQFEQPITYKRNDYVLSSQLARLFEQIERAPCASCSDWVVPYSNGAYLPVADARAMSAFVKPGMFVFEVGCGYSTVLMRECIGLGGTILGVDPEPRSNCRQVLSAHFAVPLQDVSLFIVRSSGHRTTAE
jgi:hypothetical protein